MSLPLFFKQIHSQTIGFVEGHGSSFVLLFLLTVMEVWLCCCGSVVNGNGLVDS